MHGADRHKHGESRSSAFLLADGAGSGNRTRMTSLEGWDFTIKLCPLALLMKGRIIESLQNTVNLLPFQSLFMYNLRSLRKNLWRS